MKKVIYLFLLLTNLFSAFETPSLSGEAKSLTGGSIAGTEGNTFILNPASILNYNDKYVKNFIFGFSSVLGSKNLYSHSASDIIFFVKGGINKLAFGYNIHFDRINFPGDYPGLTGAPLWSETRTILALSYKLSFRKILKLITFGTGLHFSSYDTGYYDTSGDVYNPRNLFTIDIGTSASLYSKKIIYTFAVAGNNLSMNNQNTFGKIIIGNRIFTKKSKTHFSTDLTLNIYDQTKPDLQISINQKVAILFLSGGINLSQMKSLFIDLGISAEIKDLFVSYNFEYIYNLNIPGKHVLSLMYKFGK